MTRTEKIESLNRWCVNHNCDSTHCRIHDICHQYAGSWDDQSDEDIDKIYTALWEGSSHGPIVVDKTCEEELRQDLRKEEAENRLQQAEEQLGFKFNMPQCDEVTKMINERGDQKAKADYGKEELTLVPRRIIHDICAIRMYGNKKYPEGGPDNWKQVEIERYRNATFRHFLAYLDDPQGKDKESGFPHLWHLACNIAFLCEMEDRNAQESNRNS